MSNDCAGNDHARIRVVRGDPTDEELAALVAAVLARTARAATATGHRPAGVSGSSRWVLNSRPGVSTAGLPAGRGADAWRTSALPTGR